MRLILILALAATTSHAETPLDATAFDAYVTGKTLTFGTPGEPSYGVEQYLPGRRVIWSGAPGECTNGVWYESKGSICFRYETREDPQCWEVHIGPTGMRARLTSSPDGGTIEERTSETLPLVCDNLNS
jgi:hypothetical protein